MANLRELNSQFDALGMTNIRVAMITRGEHKGKFAIIQIIPNGQPKQMYMSNTLENCENYVRGRLKLPSKIKQQDIKSTRMVNSWLKQNGLGNVIKVASELKGNRRVYSVYSLDPRVKNKELYKGTLNHCIDFIKSQTGIKENVVFADLKSNMRRVDKPVVNNMFTGNTQVKQPVQTQNKVNMIRNVDDANRWLQSIGADKKYKFCIDHRSNTRKTADLKDMNDWIGTIYDLDYRNKPGDFLWSRSLYLMVQVVAREMKKTMPPCIDDRGEKVVDVASANRWIQKIGHEKEIKFGTAIDKFGRKKYTYADCVDYKSMTYGRLEIKGIFDNIEKAVIDYCSNYGEPAPYTVLMDK